MDRDKSLEMAIGQIEKQYGKGSVMRMGEKTHMDIEAIPTGALALDLALGVGGLPRGRIVEIFGPESSGKCVVAGTYVWTDRGLETIAELFERCGQQASCTSRITPIADLGVRAVNERAELETVGALTHNYRRPVRRVRLESGREVTATHNHPLRVVNERGFIVWREVGQIEPGDVVVSAMFGATEAAAGDGLSEDEAVLLGYLVAEGSLGYTTQTRFTNGDLDVGQEYTRLAEQLFGVTVKCYNGIDYAIHDKEFRTLLAQRYGMDYVRTAGKTVPHCVRTGGQKVQRAFLSALFEGDGWIDPSSTVGLGTASEDLARQVQLLLFGFGIPCSVRATFNRAYERDYWSVTINSGSVHRFIEQIGFRSERRQRQVAAHFRTSRRDPQCENIPRIREIVRDLRDDIGGDREFDRIAGDLFRTDMDLACSRARLTRIVAWAEAHADRLSPGGRALLAYLTHLAGGRYTYETVVSVEDAGSQPTFDLALPKSHSFIANGVLSHNTTLAMHVVAEAQRNGGICAYIDAEHAMDPVYARAIGVNVDELLISQPDTGEQALEIADMLIRSGALDVLVIDSVAALTPRAEIEGEMGDSHVGLQARLMSQALRKLTATLNKANTIAIFINQLREKIGVIYGCMSYSTRVTLADGRQTQIGRIVNQRLPVEVLSYDPAVGAVVPRKVVNWFDNGKTDHFLQFTVAREGGNGRSQFACTPNHQVRTPGGWREAQELAVGDRVLQAVPYRLSEFQWEVVRGGLMGDGCVSPTRFRLGQGSGPAEYGDWKSSLFPNIDKRRSVRASDGAVFHDFTTLPELAELSRNVHVDGTKVFDDAFLKRLTPLSLAIWYMDDGMFALRDGSGRSEICIEAMEPATRDRLVAYLAETWGIVPKLIGRAGSAVLVFPKEETAKLHALIAPFVHPSMAYKLLPRYRGRFKVDPVVAPMRYELVPMPITKIAVKPPTRSMHRFDIEVEGSHNYLVDGVMVHNSPEVTPGGRALKFYSSVRLDIRRIESIKDGVEVVGNRVRVKVVKNKCSSPFKQAEFDIGFGKGISREGSLLDVGVDLGLVKKSGAWYTYEGEQLGQGRENAKTFLADNPEIMVEVSERIRQAVGIGAKDNATENASSNGQAVALD